MRSFRVLHVDDEPDIREIVELSLGLDADLVTRTCASGQEALTVAALWLPDLIVLDVMMPVMDGPTTLARLRENPDTAAIPIVFMTACAQSRELDLFRSLGAAGLVLKPFDPLTLAASIRRYLEPADVPSGAQRNHFLRRIRDDAAVLSGHRSRLHAAPERRAALAGMRGVAHALAGAAGLFGFFRIGEAAAELEEAVICEINGSGSIDEVDVALEGLLARVAADGYAGSPSSSQIQ